MKLTDETGFEFELEDFFLSLRGVQYYGVSLGTIDYHAFDDNFDDFKQQRLIEQLAGLKEAA